MALGNGKPEAQNLDDISRGFAEILKTHNPPTMAVVHTRPHEVISNRQKMPSIWNAASWLRSLTYEDMMVAATEMSSIRGEDTVETPEKLAKLLHAWSKAVTERDVE